MCNPAKFTIGPGLHPRKKRGLNCCTCCNKGGFNGDPSSDELYSFCDQNRRVPCGDGVSLAGPGSLWLAGLAEAVVIAIKELISDLGES